MQGLRVQCCRRRVDPWNQRSGSEHKRVTWRPCNPPGDSPRIVHRDASCSQLQPRLSRPLPDGGAISRSTADEEKETFESRIGSLQSSPPRRKGHQGRCIGGIRRGAVRSRLLSLLPPLPSPSLPPSLPPPRCFLTLSLGLRCSSRSTLLTHQQQRQRASSPPQLHQLVRPSSSSGSID